MKKSERANQLIANLQHPLKSLIEELRNTILLAGCELTEEVKWNAPSYTNAKGEHRFTLNFPPNQKSIRLIFHRDTLKQIPPQQNLLAEDFGLLKWATTDRAIFELTSIEQLNTQQSQLFLCMREWINKTDT